MNLREEQAAMRARQKAVANGGASHRVVQKMVGHTNVTTTMNYMHSDLERTRAEYLKSHPRGVCL